MLQVGPCISAGRDGPARRPTGLYELREGSLLCGCFAWTLACCAVSSLTGGGFRAFALSD